MKLLNIKVAVQAIASAFLKSCKCFFAHTYLHGFQYFSSVKQPSCKLFDKLFWIVILSAMILSAILSCDIFLYRFNQMGIKHYIATDYMSIGVIPFPAITVCPTQNIISSKLDQIIEKSTLVGLNVTLLKSALDYFDFSLFKTIPPMKSNGIDVIATFLNATNMIVSQLMQPLSFNCHELLEKCRWQGVIMDCEKLFTVSTSYAGYCCSFNYLDDHRIGSIPKQTSFYGQKNGLSFAMNIPKNIELLSPISGSSIKILIHKSHSYPSYMVPLVIIGNSTETIIFIKPQFIIANNEVKSLAVKHRNCYLKEESSLKYFKVYSFQNCVAECIMDQVYELCSCVPYFYPSYTNLSVCDQTSIACLYHNIEAILVLEARADNFETCRCLNTCNQISYPYSIAKTKFIIPTFTVDPFYKGLNESHTIVHVTMARQTMRILKTELTLNWIQLIANIGGVASLFTGLSIVGCIHFLYHVTLKWIFNLRIKNKLAQNTFLVRRVLPNLKK